MRNQKRFPVTKRLGRCSGAFGGSHAGGSRIDFELTPLRHTSNEEPVKNGIPVTWGRAILCKPGYAVSAGFDRDPRNWARPRDSMDRIDGVTAD